MDCGHTADVRRRLARIEGQIKGVREMVDADRPCEDILMQLSAVSSAVTQAARVIMTQHLEHCVVDGIKNGDEAATVANLKKAVDQFAKMK